MWVLTGVFQILFKFVNIILNWLLDLPELCEKYVETSVQIV
jgi:hypothetical protein